ncbi:MAG: hypothetical protein JWM87_1457 [Candidatus Eremiobacteraeota bacterium]|nr:hypothetical protein [Candidatus Eremiobacteraeota bacterium]
MFSYGSASLANPTTTSLHYDGDMLLFATDANGHLAFLRNELLGEYNSAANGSLAYRELDRDFAELAVTTHNESGYDGLSYVNGEYRTPKLTRPVDVYEQGGGNVGTIAFAPTGGFGYIHPDGFETLFGTIQGTRISDSFTGTWTTPDAYAGDVHDPMSQKPFMWNRNNPYDYSDPSGFCPKGHGCMGETDFTALREAVEGMLTAISFIIPASGEARAAGAAAEIARAGVTAGNLSRSAQIGQNLVRAEPVGSALKSDVFHRAGTFLREEAAVHGTHFKITGSDGVVRELTQIQATINGKKGVVEFIVETKADGTVELQHQLFKEGGVINGKPN